MTGPEHYAAAERLLNAAENMYTPTPPDVRDQQIARAMVHAQLATCAATVDLAAGRRLRPWRSPAGRQLVDGGQS